MRCETSFFSLTLYKKLLTRYWPMWVTWLMVWLFALPVNFWNRVGELVRMGMPHEDVLDIARDLENMAPVAGGAGAVAAIVVAAGVFFYLFNNRATVLTGSLPMRREGLFATSVAAGLTMLLGPLVLAVLITLIVEAAVGAVAAGAVLRFLGSACLTSFFWFSFAALCCVISGNLIASLAFYAIFNWVVLVMANLLEALGHLYFYGFAGMSDGVNEAVRWCTPFMALCSYKALPTAWYERVWIFAGVGFLMFLAALGLFHIRKAERAGDLVAFKPLRYVFKVCVIFCGGVALGMALCLLFFSGMDYGTAGVALTVCCVIAAVVCAFVAEMLLKKSFRVWKSWRWALVSALCFAVVLTGLDFDVLGYADRVPQAADVSYVHLTVNGNDLPSRVSDGVRCQGDAAVGAVTDIHRQLAQLRSDDTAFDGDPQDDWIWRSVSLTYHLKNGAVLRRQYSLSVPNGGKLETALDAAINSGTVDFDISRPAPQRANLVWSTDDGSTVRDLEGADVQALWDAIREDVSAGRYTPSLDDADSAQFSVELQWEMDWEGYSFSRFFPTDGTTAVNAVLARVTPASMKPAPSTSVAEG